MLPASNEGREAGLNEGKATSQEGKMKVKKIWEFLRLPPSSRCWCISTKPSLVRSLWLLSSTLLHSTNCCLLNVFLDDFSSRLPGYAQDTFRARWAFVIGICDLLFEIFQDQHKGHLWFVICYWNLWCRTSTSKLFMMTQVPTISTLFRILSGSSRIQKKRRSVTFYQSWVQVYRKPK